MKVPALFSSILSLFFLAGCTFVPRMTIDEIENSFYVKKCIATEQQQQDYNKAILEYERGGRALRWPKAMFTELASEGMVESAKFIIENDVLFGEPTREMYTEKSLKCLIQNGGFAYINDYWKGYASRSGSPANVYSYDLNFRTVINGATIRYHTDFQNIQAGSSIGRRNKLGI